MSPASIMNIQPPCPSHGHLARDRCDRNGTLEITVWVTGGLITCSTNSGAS